MSTSQPEPTPEPTPKRSSPRSILVMLFVAGALMFGITQYMNSRGESREEIREYCDAVSDYSRFMRNNSGEVLQSRDLLNTWSKKLNRQTAAQPDSLRKHFDTLNEEYASPDEHREAARAIDNYLRNNCGFTSQHAFRNR